MVAGWLPAWTGAGADVTAFDAVQFRATVNPGYRANEGTSYQDLSLSLVDGTGAEGRIADVGIAGGRVVEIGKDFREHMDRVACGAAVHAARPRPLAAAGLFLVIALH